MNDCWVESTNKAINAKRYLEQSFYTMSEDFSHKRQLAAHMFEIGGSLCWNKSNYGVMMSSLPMTGLVYKSKSRENLHRRDLMNSENSNDIFNCWLILQGDSLRRSLAFSSIASAHVSSAYLKDVLNTIRRFRSRAIISLWETRQLGFGTCQYLTYPCLVPISSQEHGWTVMHK